MNAALIAAVRPTTESPALLRVGLRMVARSQLLTGEMSSLRVLSVRPKHRMVRSTNVLVSTLAHDALACFDPTSREWNPDHFARLERWDRAQLSTLVRRSRRAIRRFVAWHERADGSWCFFGRGSGLPPDAATTACAAACLLDSYRSGPWGSKHAVALARFRTSEGLYATYVGKDGRKYSWLDEHGGRVEGLDPVFNAHALRYLALVGAEHGALAEWLETEAAQWDGLTGSREHPEPMFFAHAVSRAWRQASIPGLERMRAHLVPKILAARDDDGGLGTFLGTALGVLALIDLGYDGEALRPAALRVAQALLNRYLAAGDAYTKSGIASSSTTRAIGCAALARATMLLPGPLDSPRDSS